MAWWGLAVSTVGAMTIDQASFEPVYRQLARILREQIRAGELRAGAALPSEASLSQRFGVGRDAVRDALSALRGEGLVITTRGIGTFVRGSPRTWRWSGWVRAPGWRRGSRRQMSG